MAARIAFMTHYPDRMGELAGKPTFFQEKIWSGLEYKNPKEKAVMYNYYQSECRKIIGENWPDEYGSFMWAYHPKTTTIRSNYEYWKSKEGQLIQPFFWAGKPYRSKHVVFCPEVRLKKVEKIEIDIALPMITIENDDRLLFIDDGRQLEYFTQNEGFDDPDHFWMWFDRDFNGAYLELESVGG